MKLLMSSLMQHFIFLLLLLRLLMVFKSQVLFGVLGLLYAVNGNLHSLFWWVANIVIILLIVTCIKRVKNGLAEVIA